MKVNMVLAAVMAACYAQISCATVIENGSAYAIADNFVHDTQAIGVPGEGSHFHASNELPVDPDNSTVIAANMAEVGGFFGEEEIRGLVEFDLRGRVPAEAATLSFDVADVSGLIGQPVGGLFGQPMYVGGIDGVAYVGNNAEDLSDFQASSIAPLGTVQTDGMTAGQTTTWDVTQLYNERISAGNASLAVRLQIRSNDPIPDGAITFDNFRLTVVPEPSTLVLAWLALAVLLGCRRRVLGT